MENEPPRSNDVIIAAPLGRDGAVIYHTLVDADLSAMVCADVTEVCRCVGEQTGALVLVEEVLTRDATRALETTLRAQPSWSDLPIVLLSGRHGPLPEARRAVAELENHAGVTVLERPVAASTLVSAVRSALVARRRQYQVRDLVVELRSLNASLEERIEERTRQVRELAAALTLAEQAERRRISQILHDDLQQLLYGVRMRLGSLRRTIQQGDDPAGAETVEVLETWTGKAIDTTRRLTVDLYPPVLQREDFKEALVCLGTQMEEMHGLSVEIRAERSLFVADKDLRILLYQIIRELLFNTAKHAGVDRAWVTLTEVGDRQIIEVRDEGAGFDPKEAAHAKQEGRGGFGLFSSRERLQLVGGTMEIDSSPGNGTRTTIRVPRGLEAFDEDPRPEAPATASDSG